MNLVLIRIVRWTGWPLFPLTLVFLVTGYSMSGQAGFGGLMNERTALAIHKLGHLPLLVLLLLHTIPATFLAMQRWGWIKVH